MSFTLRNFPTVVTQPLIRNEFTATLESFAGKIFPGCFPGQLGIPLSCMRPGERIRRLRVQQGLSTHDIERLSKRIAAVKGSDDFYISSSWASELETSDGLPSVRKLLSLCGILRIDLHQLLGFFGLDINKVVGYQFLAPPEHTGLALIDLPGRGASSLFPVRLDPGFDPNATVLLSRVIQAWGEIPVGLIETLNLRHSKYGFIGSNDYTLYPLLRPGSFVQIDDRECRVEVSQWRSELDRPIYFVELRDGYACSWCEWRPGRLTLVPHPLSPCGIREFASPRDAEIVGRVTGVAMRLVDGIRGEPNPSPGTRGAIESGNVEER